MNQGEIVLYQDNNNSGIQIEVRVEKDTIWLTQKQMAKLFDCSTDNISLHLRRIYKDK